jgi:hypothetical protein
MPRRTAHALLAGLAAAAVAASPPRQRMDRPHGAEDGALSPAVIDGHRLELADACRAALEAFDRGAGHRTRA